MSYKEIIDNVSNIEDLDNVTILKVLEEFSKTIKDFAIEQSGLNNLVNVEFIPSDNNTTYTGDSVDYLGTLKLTLSDNIIVNKSCNIKFNIKGSNTIVVNVDEFNNSLELHLDNSVVTTLAFAESERQKSKNLFDTTKAENVGYNWNGTLNSNNAPHYISCGFIKIKPNTNYIFSLADSTITMNYTGALFYTLDKTYISYVECNGNTFITPSNAEYMICQFWFESNPMNYKDIIQIEEGSVATDYQPYNGAIVHEKNIADVEHIETIYEMNTKNTIGGTAYTAGIPFSNISISNVDFNKYKYLRFTCRWNYHLNNWFGGTITFDLDLQTPYNIDSNYLSVISNRPSDCFANDGDKTFDLVGQITVNENKSSLSVNGYKITYTGEKTDYTSNNYLPYFRIEKIEGVF